jgi:hypothetical protein
VAFRLIDTPSTRVDHAAALEQNPTGVRNADGGIGDCHDDNGVALDRADRGGAHHLAI